MRQAIPFCVFAALAIAVQMITALTGTDYFLTQITMSGWYALVVMGLCMLMGYAGQISIGHAAFFAIGGYTAAVLTTMNLLPCKNGAFVKLLSGMGMTIAGTNSWGTDILYLSPWLSLIAAVLISVFTAWIIGIPVLRLKGHYLAMATLGFGTIIYRIALGTPLFGGADGLSDVPPFRLFAGLVIDGSRTHRLAGYYCAMAMILVVIVMLSNLVNSRAGRALRAIHGNEEAAQAMGIDTARYKLNLFVLSAVIAAIAGVFMTHYNGGIGPAEAGVMKSIRYVAIVAVGGMANLWGTLVAGMVLNFLSLRGYFGSFDDAVFGAVLILMMVFAPNGILVKRRKRQ